MRDETEPDEHVLTPPNLTVISYYCKGILYRDHLHKYD